MPIGTTAALIGASLAGSVIQAGAAGAASRAQQDAANRQIDLFGTINKETTQRFQPFLATGRNALGAYNYELGLGHAPRGYKGFQATPGYQFRLREGQKAVEGSAASQGGLFSGNTLKALNDHAQGVASQEYGSYLNRLGGLASSGQNAAGNLAAAGANYGQMAGNALSGLGNAQAAGAIGIGNAFSGGLGNIAGILQYQNTMNRLGF